MAYLSVVIPTLNAAATLPACLGALADSRTHGLVDQLVVVDGGSRDATVEIARAGGAVVMESAAGRGRQLAKGADIAAGGWLLFLHADTVLSPGWATAATDFMAQADAGRAAAVFRLAFDEDSRAARRVAGLANWRARHLGLPYGDQGLLIPRELYEAVGGFADVPLMEDVGLVRRIGRRRLRMLDATAVTSAGRYRRAGWWSRSARNLAVLSLYFLGVPPRTLKRFYG